MQFCVVEMAIRGEVGCIAVQKIPSFYCNTFIKSECTSTKDLEHFKSSFATTWTVSVSLNPFKRSSIEVYVINKKTMNRTRERPPSILASGSMEPRWLICISPSKAKESKNWLLMMQNKLVTSPVWERLEVRVNECSYMALRSLTSRIHWWVL